MHAQVSFEIADIMTCDLRPNFYDVIYSRDTILHIEDKLTLFKRQVTDILENLENSRVW